MTGEGNVSCYFSEEAFRFVFRYPFVHVPTKLCEIIVSDLLVFRCNCNSATCRIVHSLCNEYDNCTVPKDDVEPCCIIDIPIIRTRT